MNRNDLIKAVAKGTGMTQDMAKEAINTTFNAILRGLKEEGRVLISGFGSLRVNTIEARERYVPTTGVIMVPEHKKVKFKASPELAGSL